MKRDPWYWQRWAFGQRVGNPVRKLILTALAAKAESDTGYCYAAQEELASYAECDERTVRRHLAGLEESGMLTRRHEYRQGGGRLADGFLLLDGRASFWPDGTPIPDNLTGTAYRTEEGVIPDRAASALQPSTTTLDLSEERASAPVVKVGGKVVPQPLVAQAERALAVYCDQTERKLRPYGATGKPSESLTRILSRLLDAEPMTNERVEEIVRNVLANPPSWVEGQVEIGDIFGPRAFERALSNDGKPTGRKAVEAEREERRARRRAARDRLAGGVS